MRLHRLGQIGVAPGHFAADPIKGRGAAGEHDDLDPLQHVGQGLDTAAGLVAVHAGHEHIQQNADIGDVLAAGDGYDIPDCHLQPGAQTTARKKQ